MNLHSVQNEEYMNRNLDEGFPDNGTKTCLTLLLACSTPWKNSSQSFVIGRCKELETCERALRQIDCGCQGLMDVYF